MSGGSVGALVGGIAGAVVGSFFGMTALGWMIGSTLGGVAGNILDPTVQKGPELNDLKLQRSQYGAPFPYVWGRFRLAGVVDWIGNNGELVPHKQSSGGKGGGGEQETTSYTGSWSIKFNRSTRPGEQALVAIDKWWATGRIVNNEDINPTVYIGWNLQLPDSSQEADLGVGNVSADRFFGKAVFNEVQMEQFGNALPNMEALVRTVGEVNGDITQLASHAADTAFERYPRVVGDWPINWEADQTLPPPPLVSPVPAIYREPSDGAFHRLYHCADVYMDAGGGLTLAPAYQDHASFGKLAPIGGNNPGGDGTDTIPNLGALVGGVWFDILAEAGVENGRYLHSWCTTQDSHTLVAITAELPIGHPDPVTDYQWHKIIDGALDSEGTVGDSIPSTAHGINIGSGNFGHGGANPIKGVVEPQGIYIWSFFTNAAWVGNPTPAEQNEQVALFFIDTATNTLEQYNAGTVIGSYGNPAAAGGYSGCVYCPGNGYVATVIGGGTQYALYTRLDGFGQVTLAEVLRDVFEMRDGLPPARFDVSAAESVIIHGVAMASVMQKRNFVAMLMQAYDFDICESDDGESGLLKVVFRGGDPVAEIPDEDLGVHEEGEETPSLLEITPRVKEDQLPARVNVGFYNADLDYQIDSQPAQRASPFVDNVTTIDLPIVLTASQGRAIAKRELFRAELERDNYAWRTSRKWAHLEPTDVVTVQSRDLRITKKTERPNGVILWEGLLSAPYIAEQPEDGAPGEGTIPNPPSGPRGATELVFFDVPMISDEHLDVGIYVGVRPVSPTATWTGASVQKSADGGATWAEVASITTRATMGTVAQPIGGSTVGNVFDNSTVIRVENVNDALESFTELAVLSGSGWYVLGKEIFGATTATQIDATTWDLSGLLRGRRGTEWAMGTHGIDETLVLASTLVNLAVPAADVGLERHYRAVTFGTTTASATSQSFIATAQSARCYAPVHVSGGVTDAAAMLFEAVARTRRNGAWRDSVEIGQADTPPEFVLEVWNATYTQTARIVSGLSSPTYTYSSANQITDFGAAQQFYYITWAQVGQFGLGIRARGVIPGPGSSIDPPVDPGDGYNPPPDPPGGGGAVDLELAYPLDNKVGTAFRIGDTLVGHFVTGAAPVSGHVGTSMYSTPYGLHIILSTDVDGDVVVAEKYGFPVASIELGTQYPWSVPLLPATNYYAIVRAENAPGELSGAPGTLAPVAITLAVET